MANILIIDDSRSMIIFLEQALSRAGHTVVSAENGKAGLEQMKRRSFDLVVSDLYMPEADGLEMITRCRESGILPRVIAISSKDYVMNLLPVARKLGALRALQKPFTAEQLIETVESVLRLPVPSCSPLKKRDPAGARRAACSLAPSPIH